MKQLLSILLALALMLSLAACGSKQDGGETQEPDTNEPQIEEPSAPKDEEETPGEAQEPSDAETPAEEKKDETTPEVKPAEKEEPAKPAEKPTQEPAQPVSKPEEPAKPAEQPTEKPASSTDPLSILTTVWNSYTEEEKFPAAGGDYDHVADSAPGSFDLSNTDNLSYQLTFPADDASLIDSAASLVHMMNTNTFTCGAFHLTDKGNASRLAGDLRSAIQGKQWMCGFPDKLVIASVDDCLLSLYGNENLVNTFRDKLTASFGAASVLYDEAIEF